MNDKIPNIKTLNIKVVGETQKDYIICRGAIDTGRILSQQVTSLIASTEDLSATYSKGVPKSDRGSTKQTRYTLPDGNYSTRKKTWKKLWNDNPPADSVKVVVLNEQRGEDYIRICVKPNYEISSEILRIVGGPDSTPSQKKSYVNELIPYVEKAHSEMKQVNPQIPDFNRDVYHSIITNANSRYRAKDPSKKIPRNLLYLSSQRTLPRSDRVGLKISHWIDQEKPEGSSERMSHVFCGVERTKDGYKIWISFDSKDERIWLVAMGDWTNGKGEILKKELDYFARCRLDKMCKGELNFGIMQLNEKDGGLSIEIPYEVVPSEVKFDQTKILQVTFEQKKEILPDGREGKMELIHMARMGQSKADAIALRTIYTDDTLAILNKISWNSERLNKQKESVWDKKRVVSDKQSRNILAKKIHDLAEKRTRFTKNQNHMWSSSIVKIAENFGCGVIKIFKPHLEDDEIENQKKKEKKQLRLVDSDGICHSFPFGQLLDLIKMKAAFKNIQVCEIEGVVSKEIAEVVASAVENAQ